MCNILSRVLFQETVGETVVGVAIGALGILLW